MKENGVLKVFGVVLGCAVVVSGGFFGAKFLLNKSVEKPNITESNNGDYYKDYKYKLLFEFGDVHEIYLLANNEIKPLFVTEEYEVCEGFDCMTPTGKNNYEEINLDFSEDAKKEVLNLFNKLSQYSQNKVIDTRNIKLDIQDERILHALLTNDEDRITLSKNLVFDTEKKSFKNSNGYVTFENSKTYLKNSNNSIVNNISTYLNKIVDAKFADINNLAMEQIDNQYNQEEFYNKPLALGVDIKTELELDDIFYISLTINEQGNMGGVNWLSENGYVFNAANGEIVDFSGGWKDYYYQEALKDFVKKDVYIDAKEDLFTDWESILKEEMFKVGNWYLDGNDVVFLIDGSVLGFDEATCKLLELKVPDKHWTVRQKN